MWWLRSFLSFRRDDILVSSVSGYNYSLNSVGMMIQPRSSIGTMKQLFPMRKKRYKNMKGTLGNRLHSDLLNKNGMLRFRDLAAVSVFWKSSHLWLETWAKYNYCFQCIFSILSGIPLHILKICSIFHSVMNFSFHRVNAENHPAFSTPFKSWFSLKIVLFYIVSFPLNSN